MKISLVMGMQFFFSAMVEMTRAMFKKFSFFGLMQFLSNRGPCVLCIYTRVRNRIQKQIFEYDIIF